LQVSWVRKRDGHLLTVDTDTFIGDGRFQVHHPANSDIWTLHLRAVRGSDAGKYECQVSSEPKLSLVYQLNIVGEILHH
jgi:Immunoglobulin I-set domain